MQEDRYITTYSKRKTSMAAEKLALSYPVGKGVLTLGEEYTRSSTDNRFNTEYANLNSSHSTIKESNMACFVEIMQQLGRISIGAGLRYEHLNYDYFEHSRSENNLSRTYNNIFPSFNANTRLGDLQMSLSYGNRVERPGYSALNANVHILTE